MLKSVIILVGIANCALENKTKLNYEDYDDERSASRYLMDYPICTSVEECADVNGCSGKIFTEAEGSIQVSDYSSRFNCRWEVRAPAGQQISIIVDEGSFFGIEHSSVCGADGLKIHGQEEDELVGFGRICSSGKSTTTPYNGMSAHKTKGGVKIQSKLFREWLELDTDHLVVGFDSDQDTEGAGFLLRWRFEESATTTTVVTSTGYPPEPGTVSSEQLMVAIKYLSDDSR